MLYSKTATNRLLVPGRVVGSTDGRSWIVLSSMKTAEGLRFKLADLGGRPVPTPSDFDPVSFRTARFAAMLRRAFFDPENLDFDEYVKIYIRHAGLPVDQSMNWTGYLHKVFSPQHMMSTNQEAINEAILKIVDTVLLSRKGGALNPENKSGFQQVTARPAIGWANEPEDKQVSKFLMKQFKWRVGEAKRYVHEVLGMGRLPRGEGDENAVPLENIVSLTPEDEESASPLDTASYATGTEEFEKAEQDVDIGDYRRWWGSSAMGRFAEPLKDWLKEKYRTHKVRQYMRLLSILHNEYQSYSGQASARLPKFDDIERDWVVLQNKYENYRNRLDPDSPKTVVVKDKGVEKRRLELPSMKELYADLPILIEVYVRTHGFYGKESSLPDIVRILYAIGAEKRKKQIGESQGAEKPQAGTPETPQAPPIEEAAMMELPKAGSKQFQLPTCTNCGTGKEPLTCPGCNSTFCSECLKDHHQHNPGHDGL